MSEHVAVLNIGDILLVTAPADLDETAVFSLQEELSARIVETAAHGVVIDVTALDSVDTFVGRRLSVIASVANLLGARPVPWSASALPSPRPWSNSASNSTASPRPAISMPGWES
jgi:anti-anti-sigma regulatory factor